MKRAIFNWSGGKDSAFALHKVLLEQQYDIHSLLTSLNHETQRISMHGVRFDLLKKQANSLGLPLKTFSLPSSPANSIYEQELKKTMLYFTESGINYSIFGDIFLEDLRKYRENQSAKVGMNTVFPLWKANTTELVSEFINSGFKAIVTAVDASKLSKDYVGRVIDIDFINSLPKEVDPCGENGEFHSFVYDGPIFSFPIEFTSGEIVHRFYSEVDKHGFYFCDLV